MRTKATKITSKQLKFAELVAQGIDPKVAYVDCGYKGVKNAGKNAHNLMINRFVIAEIDKIQAKSTDSTIASLIDCKAKLTEIMNDKDTGRLTVIKAIDSLAKLSSWEVQKIALNVNKATSDMSDEELLSFINE